MVRLGLALGLVGVLKYVVYGSYLGIVTRHLGFVHCQSTTSLKILSTNHTLYKSTGPIYFSIINMEGLFHVI